MVLQPTLSFIVLLLAKGNDMRASTALSTLTLPFRNGYIFLVCVTVIFMQAGFHAGSKDRERSSAELLLDSTPGIQEELMRAPDLHPITKLIEDAEDRYRQKVGRQSTSLRGAVKEYKRRYGRPPPKGFDAWWKFARRQDIKLVDEYDGLVEDLAPFWSMSGAELRRRARQAGELPFVDIVQIRKGKAQSVNLRGHGVSGRAEGFRAMLLRFVDELPDMSFPINAHAEGRVLVPWEHRQYPNMTTQDSSQGLEAMLGGPFQADWGPDGHVWEAWRRTCDPSTAARRVFSFIQSPPTAEPYNYFEQVAPPSNEALTFVANTSNLHDYCNHPNLHLDQGHFYSDWRTIHALYPIFSPAKARGYSDIRIPSHYYFGNTPRYTYGWDSVNLEMKEVDLSEVPWEKKQNKIFWRGATNGGGNHPPTSAHRFHRQRFLRMSSAKEGHYTIEFPNDAQTDWETANVTLADLNDEIMDVAFVKAVTPEIYPGGLSALLKAHRFADSVSLGAHWGYKYLLDLDGVGYSARFMAFLASDSVPIKATVYKEFWEDWIEPWVHYIPLSPGYKEIYNIHAYFSGLPQVALDGKSDDDDDLGPPRAPSIEGDPRLRRIARAGKQWKKTMGRHVDIEAYVYRLCLEWARLVSDDRGSMDYSYSKFI